MAVVAILNASNHSADVGPGREGGHIRLCLCVQQTDVQHNVRSKELYSSANVYLCCRHAAVMSEN